MRPATAPAWRSCRSSPRRPRPTTSARIAELARGFVYVVSVTGVTGERAALPPELGQVVERVRAAADVPVAVGFGVGTPEQAAQVGEIADGVIIGSRLVRGIADAATPQAGLEDVRAFLSDTVRALDPPGETAAPATCRPDCRLRTDMWVFLGFTFGMCLFIVLWATGLAPDAAGVAGLAYSASASWRRLLQRPGEGT